MTAHEMRNGEERRLVRKFAEAWPDEQIVQQVVAQLPWYHQVTFQESLPTVEKLEQGLENV